MMTKKDPVRDASSLRRVIRPWNENNALSTCPETAFGPGLQIFYLIIPSDRLSALMQVPRWTILCFY
jgi:hypothetical protein